MIWKNDWLKYWNYIPLFLHRPIRKLLVPINQSSYLICFCCIFLIELKKQICMKKNNGKYFRKFWLVLFVQYYFQNMTVSLKKATLQKNVIFEKELDCINRDDIGNLEDSPRLLFIDEEGIWESHSGQWWWRTYWKY